MFSTLKDKKTGKVLAVSEGSKDGRGQGSAPSRDGGTGSKFTSITKIPKDGENRQNNAPSGKTETKPVSVNKAYERSGLTRDQYDSVVRGGYEKRQKEEKARNSWTIPEGKNDPDELQKKLDELKKSQKELTGFLAGSSYSGDDETKNEYLEQLNTVNREIEKLSEERDWWQNGGYGSEAERLYNAAVEAENALSGKRKSGKTIVEELEGKSEEIAALEQELNALESAYNASPTLEITALYNEKAQEFNWKLREFNGIKNEYDQLYGTFNSSADAYNGFIDLYGDRIGKLRDATAKDIIWNSMKRGYYNSIYGEELFSQMLGGENEADKYKDILGGNEYQFEADGLVGKAVSGVMEQLGQQARQLTNPRSLGMAAAAGTAAAIAGNAGPQALIPEEVITVPAAITKGFGMGSALSNLEIEGGLAYQEMLDQGISEDTARIIGLAVGGGNAALEALQLDSLIDGLKVTGGKKGMENVAQMLFDEIKRRAPSVANEVLQEVAQEGVTIAGTQIGSKIDKGEWAYSADEVLGRLGDTALSSALTFGTMNIPGTVMNVAGNKSYNNRMGKIGADYQVSADDLIAEGLSFAPETEAYKTAKEVKDKIDAGGTASDADLGRVVAANERAIQDEERKAAQESAARADSEVSDEQVSQPTQEEADLKTAEKEENEDPLMAAAREAVGAETEKSVPYNAMSTGNPVRKQVMSDRESRRSQLDSLGYGENGTETFRSIVEDTGAEPGAVRAQFQSAYEAGLTNLPRERASLDNQIQEAAYNAGRMDYILSMKQQPKQASVYGNEAGFIQSDASAGLDAKTVDTLQAIGKNLGAKIMMEEQVYGGKANGSYSDGIILIAKDAENPYVVVAKHEVTHRMQELAPKEYSQYRNYAVQLLSEERGRTGTTLVEDYQDRAADAGVHLTADGAMDEIAADFTERILTDESALRDFVNHVTQTDNKDTRTMGQKFFQAVREFIDKVKRLFKGDKAKMDSAAMDEFGATIDQLEKAEQLWKDAYRAAEKAANEAGRAEKSDGTIGTRYSMKEDGSYDAEGSRENRKAFIERNERRGWKTQTYGETAVAFVPITRAEAGGIADGIRGELRELGIRSFFHGGLQANFDGTTHTLTGEAHTIPGHVVGINARTTKNVKEVAGHEAFHYWLESRAEFEKILVDNIQDYAPETILFMAETALIYEQNGHISNDLFKEEFKARISGMLHANKRSDVLHKMLRDYDAVKAAWDNLVEQNKGKQADSGKKFSLKDSDGRELSNGQQEYFKDSKAVDESGNLLTLYHGTRKGGFTTFRDWSYLTASKSYANRYADNNTGETVYEVYANITKPFDTRLKEVRELWRKDFFGTYSRTELQESGLPDWTDGYDLAEWIEENGYDFDGILLDEGADYDHNGNVKERGISYVVRSSEQIKNVDNLNPTDDKDIRHSLKGQNDLMRENAKLREVNQALREQFKTTKFAKVDKKALDSFTKQILKDYDSRADINETRNALDDLYTYIANGEDGMAPSWDEAYKRAYETASGILESASVMDDEMYRTYKDLRERLRNVGISISPEYGNDLMGYEDLHDFRKRNFGRLKIAKDGVPVDTLYQDLSETYPELFDATEYTTQGDQLVHIADVLQEMQPYEVNPYSRNMREASTWLANDIMERFYDLPQAKPTFADKAERKLTNMAVKDAKKLERVREQKDKRIRQLIESGREKVKQTQEKERTKRTEAVQKVKDHYKAKEAKASESRKAREIRAKILRHTKDLSEKLLRPSDKKHIPEQLRGPVAAMLESINQESRYTIDENGNRVMGGTGTPTKRTEAFLALKAEYAKVIAEGLDIVIDPSLFGSAEDKIVGGFDEVIAMKDIKLADMSLKQLQTVWHVVRAVEHSVTTAGKILSKAKYDRTVDWAQAFSMDTDSRVSKNSLTKNHALIDLENPYTFFSHYGEAGKAVYRMLRDAQDQQQIMVDRVKDEVRKVVDPKTVKKLEETVQTFTTQRGDEITLSTAHVMELYELMKREQSHEHLMEGGVVQPDIKSKNIRRGTDSILLSADDLMTIIETLTPEQEKIADGLQAITTGILAEYGNRASMEAYGYKKFTEENYWPIWSAKEGLHSNIETGGNNTRSIKNIGLAKTTKPHASNPLDLAGIFSTFARHTSDMTEYAAWLCPMEDVNRLFNFEFRDEEGKKTGKTIKGLLDRVGGPGSQKYWHRLMEDIQNGINANGDSPMFDIVGKGIGSFKGAAVGANLRVVIQQPTAFFRASAVLDPKDMARGLAGGVTKGDGWKKAMQYSPIARRKDAGGFDISSPYKMSETLFDKRTGVRKLNDALAAPAGMADAVTWGKLWNACEWATAREHKGMEKGSDAFYQQTAALFAEVIDQTQVVDGVLQRSNIMRSSNAVVKQATSFMGEPIMSLNMLMRAYDQVRYEKDPRARGRAIKMMGRAATALVVTNVVNALAQSLIDAMRDDDEDKKYWERFIAAFTGVTGDEETPWEKAWNVVMNGNVGSNANLLGQVPFVKDVLSIMQGYDVSRTEMEIVSDLINAGKTAIQSAGGNGKKTRAYAVKSLLAAGAKLFGIPLSNLTRDVWGIARSIAVETGNIPLQYEMEKAIYNLSNAENKSRYYDIMFRALSNGDMDSYRKIYADLMDEMGLDGSTISSAMKTRYDKAKAADPGFTLSQEVLDLIGSRVRYDTDKVEKFSDKDLTYEQFQKYSEQRAEDYRDIMDDLTKYNSYRTMDAEGRNALESAAWNYANETALEDASGGQYQTDTKWIALAKDAEEIGLTASEYIRLMNEYGSAAIESDNVYKAYDMGVDVETYLEWKDATGDMKADKDMYGKTISGSKKQKVMDYMDSMGLTDEEYYALLEIAGYKVN